MRRDPTWTVDFDLIQSTRQLGAHDTLVRNVRHRLTAAPRRIHIYSIGIAMQQLKPSEISELLRSKIANLSLSADVRTQGTVVSVTDGICRIHGLSDVMAQPLR